MRALLPLLLLIAAGPAWAAESTPVRDARGVATLVSDTDRVAAGQPFRIGLRLRLPPGWHTYWKNPGDAGVAPDIAVTPPAGTTVGPIEYPVPARQPEGPLMTYGYSGEVLLPLTVTPGAGPQRLDVQASWLACEKICVPEEGHFSLDLPSGAPAASAEAPMFAALHNPVPAPFDARAAADGTLTLTGAELSPATVADAWFIPDGDAAIDHAAPQRVAVGDGEVRIGLKPASQFAAGPLEGLVTLKAPGGQESSFQIAALPDAVATARLPLGEAILFALLGGAILNLMPCVFPILAMKAIGLARLSGSDRREVRSHAGAYTLGVVATFTALGGLLLALRTAGGMQGWGFQFQSPVAVALMAWLLFTVGLNLSGVFEIPSQLAGVGQGLAGRGGHAGSFFTGALAVLVATPCTAPFMAAAIAAALALPPALTLVVFAAIGVGMAAPYLALALVPGLARHLPRPGGWMAVLRGALAFPMYAAAIWLLWVASLQAGDTAILLVGGGALLLGAGAWALGVSQRAGGRLGSAVALVAMLGAAGLLVPLATAVPVRSESTEAFSPMRLAALREQGRPVFVNMTAAWCVTCLVNERVALAPEAVRAAFVRHRVAYLKGDWTSGDRVVTEFLRAQGRDGVPLYALYLPGRDEPVILPQILTEAGVLAALGDAPG